MDGNWKEVGRIKFEGERFQDHALAIDVLEELCQLQRIIIETAKEIWYSENTDRRNLPKGFEQRISLSFRRIEEGSATIPLEIRIERDLTLFELPSEEPKELKDAIGMVQRIYETQERDENLPENCPKKLLSEYGKLGKELKANDTMVLITNENKKARITHNTGNKILKFIEKKHESLIDIEGEVLEVDVKKGKFQIWKDDKTSISVKFISEKEKIITEALHNHEYIRLRVKGKGDVLPGGELLSIEEVEELQLIKTGDICFDRSAPRIEDVIMELAKKVPDEDWDKLPSDGARNLDHYLYGSPKE